MYAELINKYRATNKLKIVEVNAKDFSEIDTKIFLRELNAGEKMHLYFIFENDLKGASEDEKLLFALNMALCDSEGNRTEKDENYSLLCDLPNDLLQKLLEENTKLLTMSESEKKISAVVGVPITVLLEFPAKEIDIWLEILQAENEEEKNNSEKNTTADDVRNFFKGKIKNG